MSAIIFKMNITIRKFRKEDARELSKLICTTERNICATCYSIKIIEQFCKRNSPKFLIEKMKKRDVFVAVSEGKIVGTVALEGDDIKKFFVKHDLAGKGIGTALFGKIEDLVKKRKIKKLVVDASLNAKGFYEKMGFRLMKKAKKQHPDALPFYVYKMEKKI